MKNTQHFTQGERVRVRFANREHSYLLGTVDHFENDEQTQLAIDFDDGSTATVSAYYVTPQEPTDTYTTSNGNIIYYYKFCADTIDEDGNPVRPEKPTKHLKPKKQNKEHENKATEKSDDTITIKKQDLFDLIMTVCRPDVLEEMFEDDDKWDGMDWNKVGISGALICMILYDCLTGESL